MFNANKMCKEAQNIVYKVYLFCAVEAATYKSEDGYFQKIHQRTASATGVTEAFVLSLLKERGVSSIYNETLDDPMKKKLEATVVQKQTYNSTKEENLAGAKLNKNSKNWPPFIEVDQIEQDEPTNAARQNADKSKTLNASDVTGNDKNIRRVIKIRRLGQREAKTIKEAQKGEVKSKPHIRIRKIQGTQTYTERIKPVAQKTAVELGKKQTKEGQSVKAGVLLAKSVAVTPKLTNLNRTLSKDGHLLVKAAVPLTTDNTNTVSSIKIARVQSNDGTLLVKAATRPTIPSTKSTIIKSKSIKLSQIIPTGSNIILKAALPQTTHSIKYRIQPKPNIPSGNPSKDADSITAIASKIASVANYQSASKPIQLSQIRSKDGRIIVSVSNKPKVVFVRNDQNIQLLQPTLEQEDTTTQAMDTNRVGENEFITPDIDPLMNYDLPVVAPVLCINPSPSIIVPVPFPEHMIKEENMSDNDDAI